MVEADRFRWCAIQAQRAAHTEPSGDFLAFKKLSTLLARHRTGGRMPPVCEMTEETDATCRSTRRPIELIGSPACQRSQISISLSCQIIDATSLFHAHTPSPVQKTRVLRQSVEPTTQSDIRSKSAFDPDCVKTRRLRFAGAAGATKRSYARIASIKPPTPRMLITRFML